MTGRSEPPHNEAKQPQFTNMPSEGNGMLTDTLVGQIPPWLEVVDDDAPTYNLPCPIEDRWEPCPGADP